MGLLYKLLRYFITFCLNLFYKTIAVRGMENIPDDDPVVLVGNHHNGLIDPFLILTSITDREPVSVAAAYLFKMPVLGQVLSAFNTIPVTRRVDVATDQKTNNTDSIELMSRVVDKQGGALVIFPEGISHNSSDIMEFKTGFARAAFMALEKNPELKIHVIPVGLNYDAKNRFRSEVYIDIGQGLIIDKSTYERFKENSGEALHDIANQARDKLKEITISASNPDYIRVAHLARNLYRENDAELTQAEYVQFTKRVIQVLEHGTNDTKIQTVFEKLKSFQTQLELMNIRYTELMNTKILYYRAILTLLSIPLSLPGSIFHAPLGVLAHYIGVKLAKGYTDQEAHFKILPLIVIVPSVYFTTALLLLLFFGWKWMIMLMIFLLTSALIAIRVQPLRFTYNFFGAILRLALFNQEKMKEEQKQLHVLVREIIDQDEALNDVKELMRPNSFMKKKQTVNN